MKNLADLTSASRTVRVASDRKVFFITLAVAFVLRITFEVHSGNWTFAREFVDFLYKLFPCFVIAGAVEFFWRLFTTKEKY